MKSHVKFGYYLQPFLEISTTGIVWKRRKTGEERVSCLIIMNANSILIMLQKAPRVIEYPKAKGELVGVWKNITLKELAQVLETDLSYVYDLFLNKIRDPNFPIDDMKLLQQALRRGGKRMEPIGRQ